MIVTMILLLLLCSGGWLGCSGRDDAETRPSKWRVDPDQQHDGQAFGQLAPGMSIEEVTAIVGNPSEGPLDGGQRFLYYIDAGGTIELLFSDATLTELSRASGWYSNEQKEILRITIPAVGAEHPLKDPGRPRFVFTRREHDPNLLKNLERGMSSTQVVDAMGWPRGELSGFCGVIYTFAPEGMVTLYFSAGWEHLEEATGWYTGRAGQRVWFRLLSLPKTPSGHEGR